MDEKRKLSSLSAFAVFKRNKIVKKKKFSKLKRKSLANSAQKTLLNSSGISTSTRIPIPETEQKTSTNESFSSLSNGQKESILLKVDTSDHKTLTHPNTSEAQKTFEWLVNPVSTARFFDEFWDKSALAIRRKNQNYYKGLFSCAELNKIMREKSLKYSSDIDVTSYRNGVRETHNGDGRAYAAVVWDQYQTGCSVRLLKPQTYSRSVWKLCATLQEYFGSFVGGNVYLTPPGSQGFAPHYDDIEAFVLQLEGKKHWKIFKPRTQSLELPRYSSENFTNEDDFGTEVVDIVLQPGDLLYFPRGYVHYAKTTEEEHSLHLTLSTCQRNTWGDFLEKLIPRAIQMAFEEDIEYRKLLPRDYLSYMGIQNCDKECPERDAFLRNTKILTERLSTYLTTDAAADQMAKAFIHSALPPVISARDHNCSIHGNGEYWDDGTVCNAVEIDLDSRIRVIKKSAMRIVMEESSVKVYHSLENTRVYQEIDPQYVEVGAELVPAVEFLLDKYPEYVAVSDLPPASVEDKINIANLLYDKGLLVTDVPLTEPTDSS